jgi:hypothetical protein
MTSIYYFIAKINYLNSSRSLVKSIAINSCEIMAEEIPTRTNVRCEYSYIYYEAIPKLNTIKSTKRWMMLAENAPFRGLIVEGYYKGLRVQPFVNEVFNLWRGAIKALLPLVEQ